MYFSMAIFSSCFCPAMTRSCFFLSFFLSFPLNPFAVLAIYFCVMKWVLSLSVDLASLKLVDCWYQAALFYYPGEH